MRKLLYMAWVVALGVGGCAAEDGASPEPTPSGDESTPAATGSASAQAASEPAEATPSVEPADGRLVKMDGMSFHLPEGWKVYERAVSTIIAAPTESGDRRSFGASVLPTTNSPQEVLASHLKGLRSDGKVRRLPSLELPACTAYQTTAWHREYGAFRYDVGCVSGFRSYGFTFWESKPDLAGLREVSEPVFASLEMY